MRLSEVTKTNERVIENIISWKSDELKYEPIKMELEAQKDQEGIL